MEGVIGLFGAGWIMGWTARQQLELMEGCIAVVVVVVVVVLGADQMSDCMTGISGKRSWMSCCMSAS